jgi:hypothetical protein
MPSYAEAAAQAYALLLSPSYNSDRFSGYSRVLEFLDISTNEDNDELEEHFLDVSDASNSTTRSISAASCSSSPSATNILVSHS